MDFPEAVHELVRAACNRFPSDIQKATQYAEVNIRKLDEFESLVNSLIHHAIQDLVHERRHHENIRIKKENGGYGSGAKVNVGSSKMINDICKSVYLYNIGSRTLGLLKGQELIGIAEIEERISQGHLFNAQLCRRLRKLVRDNQKVQEVVSEKKLKNLFRELGQQYDEAA